MGRRLVVDMCEGRLLTFPNILQHQVQLFELKDRTKPGHRKILMLFLVNPNINTISSVNVLCQRKDWWREEIGCQGGIDVVLPRELGDLVFEEVGEFPIGMEEAKKVRLKQLGQSNGSITDGPVVCDNHPSTMGQQTQPSCHEFGVGNDWAEILKLAMCHGWAARKSAPDTMGQPTLAGVYCTHTLHPLVIGES